MGNKKDNRIIKAVIILSIFMTMALGINANASVLNRIDMEINIDETGNASVREIWNCEVDGGDEASRVFTSLNLAEIENFTVKDETGLEYIPISNWNSSDNRLDKFTKCAIAKKMNGDATLYWGLGNYGARAYILQYDIKNFVSNCTDRQFTYISLVGQGGVVPEEMNIKIKAPDGVDFSNAELSLYGCELDTEIKGNKLKITGTHNKLKNAEYIMLLIGYNSGQFECASNSDKNFNSIKTDADNGGGLGVVTKPVSKSLIAMTILIVLGVAVLVTYIWGEIRVRIRVKNKTGKPVVWTKLGNVNTKKSIEKLNKFDLQTISLIGQQYNIISSEYNLITAFIMKWILLGKIHIECSSADGKDVKIQRLDRESKEETINTDEQVEEQVEIENTFDNDIEGYIFNIMFKEGNELSIGDIERIYKENSNEIHAKLDSLLVSVSHKLREQGLLRDVQLNNKIKKRMTYEELECTNELKEIASEINSLKHNIKEYINKSAVNKEEIQDLLVKSELFKATSTVLNSLTEQQISDLGINSKEQFIIATNSLFKMINIRLNASKNQSKTTITDRVREEIERRLE